MDSKKAITVAVLALFLIVSVFIIVPTANAYKGSLLCPLRKNTVTIDGKWTNVEEWADALERKMDFWKGWGECYFRVKHDSSALFILVDFVSDTSLTVKDSATVAIDSEHDGASFPQRDDFRWNLGYGEDPSRLGSGYEQGEGEKTWLENWGAAPPYLVGAASMNGENDPYTQEPHRIYEFSLPKEHLNRKAIGLYVWAADKYSGADEAQAVWPLSPHDNPSQWAELIFSSRLLSEMEDTSNLVYPVEDVELVYESYAKWDIARDRQASMSDICTFKPIRMSDSTLELNLKLRSVIEAPKGTSSTEIICYALNGSILSVEKSAQLTTTLEYENTYIIDGKDIKKIEKDGMSWIQIRFIVANGQYWWGSYPFTTNFGWWSGYTQPGKYIQLLDLEPLELKEGENYEYQGQTLKTLTAAGQKKSGDWVNTRRWTWEKETGILLEYKSTGNNAKRGWASSEYSVLKEIEKRDTSLNLYVSSLKPNLGQTIEIFGAGSVLGITTVQLTIVGPSGGKREEVLTTDPSGEFEMAFTPDKEGEWTIRAEWKGTVLHNGASSRDIEFTVAPARKQFHLKVESPYGQCQGEGLYYEGAVATFSVSPTRIRGVEPFIDLVFVGWTGASTSKEANATIIMDSDKIVTAAWSKDYGGLYLISIVVGLAVVTSLSFAAIRRRRRYRKTLGTTAAPMKQQMISRRNFLKYASGAIIVVVAGAGYVFYESSKRPSFTLTSTTTPVSILSETSTSTLAQYTTHTVTSVSHTATAQTTSLQKPYSGIIEIPYDSPPISDFQTQTRETSPSFYNENLWPVPSLEYYYIKYSWKKEIPKFLLSPTLYWKHDQKWLEILLDVPSDLKANKRNRYVGCSFVFYTKEKDFSPQARDVYLFEVNFKTAGVLSFGTTSGQKPMGSTLFGSDDYRYRWSFAPTKNSSEEHTIYNVLISKKKLSKYSARNFLESYVSFFDRYGDFHTYWITPSEDIYGDPTIEIHFST